LSSASRLADCYFLQRTSLINAVVYCLLTSDRLRSEPLQYRLHSTVWRAKPLQITRKQPRNVISATLDGVEFRRKCCSISLFRLQEIKGVDCR